MKNTFYKLLLSIIGTCLIYLSAELNLSIPGTTVPQSAQTLVILCISALLPSYFGILSIALYLIAGLVGLPVFSNSGHGVEHILGPTGGYLLGFLVAGILVYKLKRGKLLLKFPALFIVMLLAHVVILTFGWLWLSKSIGMNLAFVKGVQPFIIGGIVKSVLASLVVYLVFNNKYYPKKNPKNKIS